MIYLNVSEINGLHLPETVEYVIKDNEKRRFKRIWLEEHWGSSWA